MYVQKLRVRNLRSFADASLELNVPGMSIPFANVNVLLGDNGLGKTSVLRAVALAVLGPLLSGSSGFVPDGLVRRPFGLRVNNDHRPQNPALLQADILPTDEEHSTSEAPLPEQFTLETKVRLRADTERLSWKMEPDAQEAVEWLQFDNDNPAFFIVGYGATRRVESSSRVDESARVKSRLRRYQRVAGLFEDHMSLMPLSYWLPGFAKENKGRYSQVHTLINKLLPANCQIQKQATATSTGVEHLFEINGVTLPFRDLSDGFKAYIGWIGDMLFHVCQGIGSGRKLSELRGVVMVDEIDLHLHPEWQRVVVPTLASALPNVQFIFTTHSPLVVGSLTSQNLFLLAREDQATVVKRLPELVHGKSAEQILLSPYFGLDTTRTQVTADQLDKLAAKAVSGDSAASLAYMQLLAQGTPLVLPGVRRSPRDVEKGPKL
jgi:hypothetical protein